VPVVDASVVVDWVAPDADADGPARRYLKRLVEHDAPVLAPRHLREEVANALLSGVRRQRWTGADADAAFNLLALAPIHWVDEPGDLASAWELARRYDEHPIYDLLYVAVAERLGEQLVTIDERLLAKLSGRQSVVALPS
jgi:predicted nucleic acid-binding protein